MEQGNNFGIGELIFILCIGLPILFLYVSSIIWAFFDARSRGKSGCLVALLVMFLSWPLGLIAWLIFRPNRRWRL
ncbi:MAG: hypothetical protein D6706_02015 [Chloroflexi bacterium]|nr:MAG: hypothetical protein D6706_02015 [Chloroflexota bacterium]